MASGRLPAWLCGKFIYDAVVICKSFPHRNVRRKSLVFCLFCSISFLAISANAQEWTRFRGPNGSGISHAKTIPTEIGESNLTWKAELPGVGHSSPVLWGERVFVTCA